jgi:glucoamylase
VGRIIYFSIWAILYATGAFGSDFETWLKEQHQLHLQGILNAISPVGTIQASPTKDNPNYFYDWTRDGAIVMYPIVNLYEHEKNPARKDFYFQLLMNYARANRQKQLTPNWSGGPGDRGNGEPKWNMDLSPFNQGWGRPQNDGPALRARTLIAFAFVLLKEGRSDVVRELYRSDLPAQSVIKADLEFTSHRWREDNVELWEEIRGDHFSTRRQQRRALLQGAKLARALEDRDAANWYEKQAEEIRSELLKHWQGDLGYFLQTSRQTDGFQYKYSGLDAGILLSVMGQDEDGFLRIDDEKILSTAEEFRLRMKQLYSVNDRTLDHHGEPMAEAFGRYPEDKWTGYDSNGEGNPWFLITAGAAEFSYDLAHEWMSKNEIQITETNIYFFRGWLKLTDIELRAGEKILPQDPRFGSIVSRSFEIGDRFLRRYRYHQANGEIPSEQLNRNNGYMQGAQQLTWNCAAFIAAIQARARAQGLSQ